MSSTSSRLQIKFPVKVQWYRMGACRLNRILLFIVFSSMIITSMLSPSLPANADSPVRIVHSREQIEKQWRTRIQLFLDEGTVPLVDMLSFLPPEKASKVLDWTKEVMDEEGVALISFSGYEAPEDAHTKGYRWGYFIHEIVNKYPDRFILTTNKGGNQNWWRQKGGKARHFVDQLEEHVRGGDYPFIGEIEFRHYMSGAQCKAGRTDRDVHVPINGINGHRVFKLSAETGVPLSIHHEPEEIPIGALEEMLAKYPGAKVIWAHFGQIRYPEKERLFGPSLIKRLLETYPNLYFDISTGEPSRRYKCGKKILDTIIWENVSAKKQKNTLIQAYRNILEEFNDRFVTGLDYGPANRQNKQYLLKRIENARLIMRDLSDNAKHNISYRNAWFLLTGRPWNDTP